MKKNLRIVSVAAAALLAVAPVAASAVSTVNADAITSVTQLGGLTVNNGDTVNVKPNISLNTSVPQAGINAAISVSFSATVNGTTAVSNFTPGEKGSTVELKDGDKVIKDNETLNKEVSQAAAGKKFTVHLTKVGLNFGTKNANKDVTLSFPKGASATAIVNGNNVNTDSNGNLKVKLDNNGVVNLDSVDFEVTAKDFSNPIVVTWFNRTTNAPVTAGNITLYAGSDAGKMNVAQVVREAEHEYNAKGAHVVNTTSNIKEALKAMNVDVDANGWFTAPKSFTFNMTATSDVNNATATLPITVTVPNGKEVTPATVPSQSKTIMHNAYFYDKDAKRVGTDKVTRYNAVTVAMNTTTLANGISYYEVIENGKATGKYINADNIDGTKRTLKHNAYVYKTSKKRANKVVLKKGTEVTTYGGSYTFKNGKKYYKIGANTKKTYVKVANFE
ncbi:SLAP domain-containing protein [Lactobacillus helveticus]|uniref:SLAP domain-containing protein n=1 Tax=Lactobacillus helveticus TaxID=1587 RepID=UPI001109A996|nr:SLAP domain-containing protein [Lactobacillus helveticus]TLQ23535.1 S-layer protein [Lactobacillus helveticus]